MMRYLKYKSVTWWASFVPLLVGVFLATAEIHQLYDWVLVLNMMTGNLTPSALINAGLFGIGLRGAIND